MTKSPEEGENEITREAKRQAARTGRDVAAILSEMLRAAQKARDRVRQKKIIQAQKFLVARNKQKRRRR